MSLLLRPSATRSAVMTDDFAEALEAAIQALHSPIAHHFNTGIGLTLQRRDSDIALLVINTFVNELNRPIICVHDSFVVSVRDTESLILAMNDSYKAVHKNEEDATKTKVMKGIKGVSLDFSDALTTAIEQCFEQDTDTLTDRYWDSCYWQLKKYKSVTRSVLMMRWKSSRVLSLYRPLLL